MAETEAIKKLRGLIVYYTHLKEDHSKTDEEKTVWNLVMNDLARIINEEVPEEELELHSGGFSIKKRARAEEAEEHRGFTLGLDAAHPPGEVIWLTLTELQSRMPGAPTKHVLAVWENGRRKEAEGP